MSINAMKTPVLTCVSLCLPDGLLSLISGAVCCLHGSAYHPLFSLLMLFINEKFLRYVFLSPLFSQLDASYASKVLARVSTVINGLLPRYFLEDATKIYHTGIVCRHAFNNTCAR